MMLLTRYLPVAVSATVAQYLQEVERHFNEYFTRQILKYIGEVKKNIKSFVYLEIRKRS